MNLDHIRKSIKGEEGLSLVPYRCSRGYWTVGRGHRLTNGATSTAISEEFADVLFESDLSDAIRGATAFCGAEHFEQLSCARQHALVDLCFNLGFAGLCRFKRFRQAVLSGNWETASHELEDSAYFSQVPNRAKRNKHRILTGEEPSL